jgi:hypothetical protein
MMRAISLPEWKEAIVETDDMRQSLPGEMPVVIFR